MSLLNQVSPLSRDREKAVRIRVALLAWSFMTPVGISLAAAGSTEQSQRQSDRMQTTDQSCSYYANATGKNILAEYQDTISIAGLKDHLSSDSALESCSQERLNAEDCLSKYGSRFQFNLSTEDLKQNRTYGEMLESRPIPLRLHMQRQMNEYYDAPLVWLRGRSFRIFSGPNPPRQGPLVNRPAGSLNGDDLVYRDRLIELSILAVRTSTVLNLLARSQMGVADLLRTIERCEGSGLNLVTSVSASFLESLDKRPLGSSELRIGFFSIPDRSGPSSFFRSELIKLLLLEGLLFSPGQVQPLEARPIQLLDRQEQALFPDAELATGVILDSYQDVYKIGPVSQPRPALDCSRESGCIRQTKWQRPLYPWTPVFKLRNSAQAQSLAELLLLLEGEGNRVLPALSPSQFRDLVNGLDSMMRILGLRSKRH